MSNTQVWDDKVHLFAGELIFAHFFVYADWTKVDSDLQHAFQLQIIIRAAGIQLWDSGANPLANGALTVKPAVASLPTLQGEVDDWSALDATGATAAWAKAVLLTFLVSSKADITIPVSQIAGVLGGLGPAGAAAAAIVTAASVFVKKIRLTIGHSNVQFPVVRTSDGKVSQINHISRTPVPA